ncbi:hypothetical protein [Kutzneria sp. NPDC051319]|uniref:hypothetical protein n=1 Tax=Kutzneria sp. NPDC051319 TaxID=3155047 RepID=UPI00342ACD2F
MVGAPVLARFLPIVRTVLNPLAGILSEPTNVWLGQNLTLAKVHMLLEGRGILAPYRTLHRFAVVELGFGRRQPTVRVADGEPRREVQVDFGRR